MTYWAPSWSSAECWSWPSPPVAKGRKEQQMEPQTRRTDSEPASAPRQGDGRGTEGALPGVAAVSWRGLHGGARARYRLRLQALAQGGRACRAGRVRLPGAFVLPVLRLRDRGRSRRG